MRWGLVPLWARELGKGFQPINARSETVAAKAPFAALFARPERRCLVLADGWYEWLRSESPRGDRVPFRYTVDGGEPFAFAGLWDSRRVGGEPVASATILTTAANAICAPVHDRMPCVLAGPEEEAAWLAGAERPGAAGAAGRRPRQRCARQPGGQPGRGGGAGAAGAAAGGAGSPALVLSAAASRKPSKRARPMSIHAGSRSAASASATAGSKPWRTASGSLAKSSLHSRTTSGVTSGWNCTPHARSPSR